MNDSTGWMTSDDVLMKAVANITNARLTPLRFNAMLLHSMQELFAARGLLEVGEIGMTGHEQLDLSMYANIYDEVTGHLLPGELVRDARQEELKYLRAFPVYEKVPRGDSSGKPFAKVRWIDLTRAMRRPRIFDRDW